MNDLQGKKALITVGTIVTIATLLFLAGCAYLNQQLGLPNDNPGEQVIEAAIDAAFKQQTGVDPNIDLTPEEK